MTQEEERAWEEAVRRGDPPWRRCDSCGIMPRDGEYRVKMEIWRGAEQLFVGTYCVGCVGVDEAKLRGRR